MADLKAAFYSPFPERIRMVLSSVSTIYSLLILHIAKLQIAIYCNIVALGGSLVVLLLKTFLQEKKLIQKIH